jgi:hypothetical protein
MDQSGCFLGSLSLPDKEPEAALEAAVIGFLPALGVAPEVLEAVDRHLAVDQCLVIVDASAEETVERQLVISLPAVGEDDRVYLELLQPGLALGGDALVLAECVGMDADPLGLPGRGCLKPNQLGDQFTLFL